VGPQAHAPHYNFERPATTIDGGGRGPGPRPQPAKTGAPATRDAAGVDDFLQRLARAVQQFHTYPASSPLCQNAVDAAGHALAQLEQREHVAFRVTPYEVIVDETPSGRGGLVGHELARRLHASSIAEVTIERGVTPRELARFCVDLVARDDRTRAHAPLAETLSEHGVDRMTLRTAYRPEVLDVKTAEAPLTGFVTAQQQRREALLASGGAVNHLYPPDKGWVRLDPSSPLTSVSLVDLALLAENPGALATMLLRLTDGEAPGDLTDDEALAQKFGDVTTLFSALEPRVARVMFSKLSRAVLDLPADRRQALLRRTILPGLLDGRTEGDVLRDFPDVDLAESLCLLLDLETAAPEVVTTAFARLDLPAERQAAVMPLVEDRLRERSGDAASSIEAHARRLLRVEKAQPRSFAEFAAFDLALDPATVDALQQIRDGIAASDGVVEQLDCVCKLIRLEPNPDVVQRFFDRGAALIGVLRNNDEWRPIAGWLTRCRALCASFTDPRPDVAEALSARLASLCTPELAASLVGLAARGEEERRWSGDIVKALGPGIAPALLAMVPPRARGGEAGRKAAVTLLCDHARLMGPSLAAALGRTDVETDRVIVRVLGLAGAGFETVLGSQLGSADEQTVREALRSLARIGTSQAAAIVRAAVEKNQGWLGAAAEETLWRFPLPEAHREVTALLARRDFVLRQPQLAGRLLDRAAQAGAGGLAPIAAALLPLRYRFWNPALVRLARKAHAFAHP
jgi:hypothetical protein